MGIVDETVLPQLSIEMKKRSSGIFSRLAEVVEHVTVRLMKDEEVEVRDGGSGRPEQFADCRWAPLSW